jgi:hypothetical protein
MKNILLKKFKSKTTVKMEDLMNQMKDISLKIIKLERYRKFH